MTTVTELTVLPLDAILPPAVSVQAGGTASAYTFILSKQALAATTVTSSAVPGVTITPNPLSFSTGSTTRSLTVSASASTTVGARPVTWTPSGAQYGPATSEVSVTSFVVRPVTAIALVVNETSGSLSYTVGALPDTGETMTLTPTCGASNPTCAGVLEFTPSFLTFAGGGAKTQTLTIKALAEGTQTIGYVLGGSAGAFYSTPTSHNITVNPQRTISVPSAQITVAAGSGSALATVTVSSRPTTGTTLVLTPAPIAGVTFNPASLTFSSSTSQSLSVSAAASAAAGDYAMTWTPSGTAAPQYVPPGNTTPLRIKATVTMPAFPTVYVNEASTVTVTIPSAVPAGTSLTLTPTGTNLTFTPSSLTFDGSTTSQTLSVRSTQIGTQGILYAASGSAAAYFTFPSSGTVSFSSLNKVTVFGLGRLIAGESLAMTVALDFSPHAGRTLTVELTTGVADADKISISPASVTFASTDSRVKSVTVTASAAAIAAPGSAPVVTVLSGTDAAGYSVESGTIDYVPQLTFAMPVYPTLAIGQTSAPLTATLSGPPYSFVVLTPHAEGVTFAPADITWTSDPASVAHTFTATAASAGTKTVTYTVSGSDVDGVVPPPPGTIVVAAMPTVTTVTCPASVLYTGAAHTPCSVTVTAADRLTLTPEPTYSSNVDSGTATAAYTYTGDAEHAGSTGSTTFAIDAAASSTTVTCPASVGFNGVARTPCSVIVTGAGGLSLTPAPIYADNTSVGTASASYAFAGDANHGGSSGSATFAIVDVTAPVVTVPADMTVPGVVGGTPVTFTASAVDDVDGAIAPSCAPASGSLFATGDTLVSCTATDRADNPGSASFTVHVLTPIVPNPVPRVSALTPVSAATGGPDLWIDVGGDGFIAASSVRVDGEQVTTQFVSPTALRALVPSTMLARVDARYLTVVNPSPGGGTADPMALFVTENGAAVDSSRTLVATGDTTAVVAGGAVPGAPGSVAAIAAGTGTLAVARFSGNPSPPTGLAVSGGYFGVFAGAEDSFETFVVTTCNLAGGTTLVWRNGVEWTPVQPQLLNSATGCITAVLEPTGSPALAQTDALLFAVVVPAPPGLAGAMNGNGVVTVGDTQHSFDFQTRELELGTEFARLILRSRTSSVEHQFSSRSLTGLVFSDDPSTRPDDTGLLDVDTVVFTGSGRYDGIDGYTFEARAVDRGEPGAGNDQLRVVIRNPGGAVVMTFDQRITSGSIRSLRIQ